MATKIKQGILFTGFLLLVTVLIIKTFVVTINAGGSPVLSIAIDLEHTGISGSNPESALVYEYGSDEAHFTNRMGNSSVTFNVSLVVTAGGTTISIIDDNVTLGGDPSVVQIGGFYVFHYRFTVNDSTDPPIEKKHPVKYTVWNDMGHSAEVIFTFIEDNLSPRNYTTNIGQIGFGAAMQPVGRDEPSTTVDGNGYLIMILSIFMVHCCRRRKIL